MNDADISDIILQAYSAAHSPEKWTFVLDRLTEKFSANGIIIWEWRGTGNQRKLRSPFFSSFYQLDILEDYLNRHQDREFADQAHFERKSLAFGSAAPDQVDLVNERDLYPNETEYLSTPHAKELLTYGIRHRYGALLDRDNPFHSRFSLQTSEKRGPLSEAQSAQLSKILPHFAKALELADAINERKTERAAFLGALNFFDVGICILDAQARVVESNAEFDRQVEEFGAFWVAPDSKLVLHDLANRQIFDHLLEDYRNHGAFGARPRKEAVPVNTQDKAGALCIELLPPTELLEAGSKNNRFAVLISRDTTRQIKFDFESVKLAFQLTRAELGVVDLVCGGMTNPEIAAERDRSVETINAQVKNILSKTGAANRTQLVRLMCNFPQTAQSCDMI
ncbi:MAG: helix-turn-helix transcriptional regulator [Pseudomonadota bacterium]